jgi:hypothetical protein
VKYSRVLATKLSSLAVRVLTIAAFTCLSAAVCHAGTIAFDFSSSNPSTGIGFNNTFGFQFTTLTDIFIDSVAYLDVGQNGLAASHSVGIWNSSGTLLFSTSIGTGTLAGPVIGSAQFSYTSIVPLFLPAGGTFTIGAHNVSPDLIYFDLAATQTSSAPSLVTVSPTGYFIVGQGFAQPTNTIGNHYAIVNFTAVDASVATVPEPASAGLLALGLAVLIGIRLRS